MNNGLVAVAMAATIALGAGIATATVAGVVNAAPPINDLMELAGVSHAVALPTSTEINLRAIELATTEHERTNGERGALAVATVGPDLIAKGDANNLLTGNQWAMVSETNRLQYQNDPGLRIPTECNLPSGIRVTCDGPAPVPLVATG